MELNTNHPQKDWLKKICRAIYILGAGNCWYEDNPQSNLQKVLYALWMLISNLYHVLFSINVLLAYLNADLDETEQNDLIQFTMAYIVITSKIVFLYLERDNIPTLLERILEGFRSVIVHQMLEKVLTRKSVKTCLGIIGGAYTVILVTTFDGIRAHLKYGVPIRTEVTYFPSKNDTGVAVNVFRFFTQLHWWFAVSIMAAIDSLCISSLVIVSYKFKVLQLYFLSLREKVLENIKIKPRTELEREFRKDFVIGIQMHDDALWCAKNVQKSLGNLYSVQIFESVVLLIMCLIKLVSVERNMIFLLANLSYIFCLIFLTGAYMMPAGDITYEASMVSTAMFHSGWEMVTSRELRVLAVLALQRSQAPVTMSAFGILTLSYSNFISVIRSSYSFFAVMY